jgi:glycosyltransferase involved in cell wall biosynthesis
MSYLTQARWSARHAGAVVTISEHARQSIVDTYHVPSERLFVARPAVDPIFSPTSTRELPQLMARLGITVPYVVALGGAKRRGLEVAVAAWQQLPSGRDRPLLVVVGPESPPSVPGIVHAGPLDDKDWAALLAGAVAFCYPTRFEGYGMPALEAAASGVPVVCARIGPLPEVLGDAAEWCATPSVSEIASGLSRILGNDERRKALRQAGITRAAAAPSWGESAKVICQAYRKSGQ